MDFDLRLVRHARALADEGGFAGASRAFHLTQPAPSRSVQELERRTGIRLLDGNRVAPVVPQLPVEFAIHRPKSRMLAPIADELIGDVIAADREAAGRERELVSRVPKPVPALAAHPIARRERNAAMASTR
jgi:hypothetical protein